MPYKNLVRVMVRKPVWVRVKVKVWKLFSALALIFTHTGFPPSLKSAFAKASERFLRSFSEGELRRDFSEARRAKESLALALT
jgi:hypothetical protein